MSGQKRTPIVERVVMGTFGVGLLCALASAAGDGIQAAAQSTGASNPPTEFSAGAFTAVCVVREINRHFQPGSTLSVDEQKKYQDNALPDAMKECQDFLKDIQDEEMFWRRNHRY